MQDTLDISITATHEVLRDRLRAAVACHSVPHRSRGECGPTDLFLASTSRHLSAAGAALLPSVHGLDDGPERAKEFVRQCRRLEVMLCQVKAKLYGEAHAIHRTWAAVWADVTEEFDRTLELERQLVDELVDQLDHQQEERLALSIYHAEVHSPTRPHPFLPHAGLSGRMARMVAGPIDRFWDGTESRMLPAPVHPHKPNGLFAHYLLADPDPATDEGDDEPSMRRL